MYLYQYYVTGTWWQCDNPAPVVSGLLLPWNPDSENITVTTNSVSGSEEEVVVDSAKVLFIDKDGNGTGSVIIYFSTEIEYLIGECKHGLIPYPATLTTKKTLTITYNYKNMRLVLHYNGVEVLNFVLSDSTCLIKGPHNYWKTKPTELQFPDNDTPSASYCISNNTGDYKSVIDSAEYLN